ncbi:RagB/SusD family nutrient uptake outer membrane protein [Chitinophaga nivalis]|uniref:RagB/SusD family nutrient uptake outer membrane protein n=1 Tax=Chitinophaga nivalis TaxID=2991709 RepID=A0ABT3IRE4_9BACT|nr:RagB/SusD family nutrient uptake outer membrane protein [Chitinophaga nivalis]MCW3463795.1 RagB/SusD family nutrient uptake outer membrane protein [Chitinophaga nivalis]MCW3486515.1 RagB/SusD family nutrient uptake outer membrane protein [Chitinophaga nivalis]
MMRKIIYATGLVLAITATSCKKYLDIVPVGQVIPRTVADFKKELNKAYSEADYDKGLTLWRTDEVKMNESRSSDVERVRNHFIWDENGVTTTGLTFNWQKKYKIIFYANHLIQELPDATGGVAGEKEQLMGEAHLLRAYQYFNQVNLYGKHYNAATAATDKAVPLIVKIDMEEVAPRSTVKAVYDQIFTDLQTGLSLVNVDAFETASSYKFGKISGNALATRIYLYTGQWEKALAAARAVLEKKNTLVDFNTSTELPTVYNSKEAILAYEVIYSAQMLLPAFVSDQLLSMYNAEGDLRLKRFYGKDSKGNNTVIKIKYADNNYRQSFRVAEIYLSAAEAAANLQQPEVARTYLNTLKQNRLTPAFYQAEVTRVAALTGKALLQEIYDERARELAFEGHRWFDLRRTSQPAITHMLKGKAYTLNALDARYIVRIPTEAIRYNPLLAD